MIRHFTLSCLLVLSLAVIGCSDRAGDAKPAKQGAESSRADAKGAAHDDEHDGDAEGHDKDPPTSTNMSAAETKASGVRIEVLEATSLGEQLRSPGEVVDNAYGTTLITSRVDALVLRREAKLGEEVEANAPLVTLSSVEVAQAQGALRIAEQDWDRVRKLGRDAVSGRRYAESQIAVEQARATAQAYGVTGAKGNGEFTLRAPHAGRITEDAFVVGERVEAGRTLFRLVDESVVWVDARVPAEVARRVRVGHEAAVVLGDTRLTGRVVQSAHRTSEGTRNALVRVEVANNEDRLHSGDYVEVYLDAGGASAEPVVSVPTGALVQLEGDTVLFRQSEDGAIAPVAVRTGDVVGDRTVVLEGASVGDRVVAEGAYVLKARILKSQLGEGHAH